ncbi:MAG: hypothetical protein GXY17_05205 [Clostridiaceae bacterium]|nr:hypothetical protein [Clostridiaceae bacterium]
MKRDEAGMRYVAPWMEQHTAGTEARCRITQDAWASSKLCLRPACVRIVAIQSCYSLSEPFLEHASACFSMF